MFLLKIKKTEIFNKKNMNNKRTLILFLKFNFTPRQMTSIHDASKNNHPTTSCSVTRKKNVWAGNYAAQINPQLYIFISEILQAKAPCWSLKPDGLNL